MKVQLGSRFYDIQWQYDTVPSHTSIPVVRTTCKVSVVDPSKQGRERYSPITSAYVTQNPIDRHEKDKARKLSLAKALSGWIGRGSASKEARTMVWNEYFAQRHFAYLPEWNQTEKA